MLAHPNSFVNRFFVFFSISIQTSLGAFLKWVIILPALPGEFGYSTAKGECLPSRHRRGKRLPAPCVATAAQDFTFFLRPVGGEERKVERSCASFGEKTPLEAGGLRAARRGIGSCDRILLQERMRAKWLLSTVRSTTRKVPTGWQDWCALGCACAILTANRYKFHIVRNAAIRRIRLPQRGRGTASCQVKCNTF